MKVHAAPERREAYSKAGLKLVEQDFSWKKIVSKWLDQLEQCSPVVDEVALINDQHKAVQPQISERR